MSAATRRLSDVQSSVCEELISTGVSRDTGSGGFLFDKVLVYFEPV